MPPSGLSCVLTFFKNNTGKISLAPTGRKFADSGLDFFFGERFSFFLSVFLSFYSLFSVLLSILSNYPNPM